MEIRGLGSISLNTNSEDLEVAGYVNEVGSLSQPMKGRYKKVFREKIEKGAFTRAIERAKVNGKPIKLLFAHEQRNLLASTKNGSLELEEDDIGLKFRANLIDTSLGKDVHKFVKSGLISNMSFGFSNAKDTWSVENGVQIRTLKDFDISEISILDNPAYLASSVSARGIDLIEDIEVPDIEERKEEEMKNTEKVEERAYISRQYSKSEAMNACFEALGNIYSLQSNNGDDHFDFSEAETAQLDAVIDLLTNKMKQIKNQIKAASTTSVREDGQINKDEVREGEAEKEAAKPEENEQKAKIFTFTKEQLDEYKANVEKSLLNKIEMKKEMA